MIVYDYAKIVDQNGNLPEKERKNRKIRLELEQYFKLCYSLDIFQNENLQSIKLKS